MSSEELKPCPFCGDDVSFHKDEDCRGCHLIQCGQCRAFFDFATGADPGNECETVDALRAAIAPMWNTRAQLAPIEGWIEEHEAFEADIRKLYPSTHPYLLRRIGEDYQESYIVTRWEGWRAAAIPAEKPLPELMMASYHEAIGWNACRQAMLAAPAQPAAHDQGEVQRLREALGRIRDHAARIMDDEVFYEADNALSASPRGLRMTNKNMDAQREAFEAWFNYNYKLFIANGHYGYTLERHEDAPFQYVQSQPHHDWRVWQAALASTGVPYK